MDILLVIGAIALFIWLVVKCAFKVVETLPRAGTTQQVHGIEDPITQLAIYEVMLPASAEGAPAHLVEVAAKLCGQAFTEISLTRESLMGRPVGWILSIVADPGSSEAVMISANHESPTVMSARVYQNHRQIRLDEFSAWTDEHLPAKSSPELSDLFVRALKNNWSASIRRRQSGVVTWIDLHAEAQPFADPDAQATVIDILHNAHTRGEDLAAFRDAEPIDDVSAIAALNSPAPMSLPTAVLDHTA